jgi:hypothetical protein
MFLSLADRHERLQRRLLSEMQHRAHQEVQETSANPSADRARRVRDRRQEEGTTQSSAARGGDSPTGNIPEQLLLRFKPIPESDGGTCPDYLRLTQQDQDFRGENMGLPIESWPFLLKAPVLALPQTDMCKFWMEWARATQHLRGVVFILMNPERYEEDLLTGSDILTHHGPHTAAQQDVHIRAFGYPMAVWRWRIELAPGYAGDTG